MSFLLSSCLLSEQWELTNPKISLTATQTIPDTFWLIILSFNFLNDFAKVLQMHLNTFIHFQKRVFSKLQKSEFKKPKAALRQLF